MDGTSKLLEDTRYNSVYNGTVGAILHAEWKDDKASFYHTVYSVWLFEYSALRLV